MAGARNRFEPVERVLPTPETLAKLIPDQLKVMFDAGQLDMEHIQAAAEIRTIYFAITGNLWARAHEYDPHNGGRRVLPDWIAEAHKRRYKPWVSDMIKSWGQEALPALIDFLIEGSEANSRLITEGLSNYAKRMGYGQSRHTIAGLERRQDGCR